MLDAKILTAVLASLVATGVMVNGGEGIEYDTPEVDNFDEGFDYSEFIEDPVDKIREHFRSYPEPENSVKANLTVENLHQQTINIRSSGSVETEELKYVDLGAYEVSSEDEINLHSFGGTISTGNSTVLEGSTDSVTSNNVNVSGMMTVNEEVNTSYVYVEDVERTPITLSNTGGSIESDDASTEFGQGSRVVDINSFSGDMKIFTENETVILDGKVSSLEAGSFSFGD